MTAILTAGWVWSTRGGGGHGGGHGGGRGLLGEFGRSIVRSVGWHTGTGLFHALGPHGWLIVLGFAVGWWLVARRQRPQRRRGGRRR